MRNLTQQEIDNAPGWATHYLIAIDDTVCYENTTLFMNDDNVKRLSVGLDIESQPIPQPEFDISEYEFSDAIGGIELSSSNDISVIINTNKCPWIALSKQDTIAIAKHFKLTAADLL